MSLVTFSPRPPRCRSATWIFVGGGIPTQLYILSFIKIVRGFDAPGGREELHHYILLFPITFDNSQYYRPNRDTAASARTHQIANTLYEAES